MQENRRIEQINLSIGGIIVIILVLIHSIYLLVSEKKQILEIDSLSNQEFITQALINRTIAFFVVLMFFVFALENYKNNENKNNDALLRLTVSTLAFLSITIELYLTFKNYIEITEENNSN